MATKAKTPRTAAKALKTAPKAAPASTMPTPATLPPVAAAPAKTIALRGGQAVASVKLTGTAYRTAAPHNQQWWKQISAALAAGPSAVAPMLLSADNTTGVPAHFFGYAIRRGYLAAV